MILRLLQGGSNAAHVTHGELLSDHAKTRDPKYLFQLVAQQLL